MNFYKDKVFKKEILGNTMKKYRLAYDLSVEELARLLGVSSAFVGLIERGERGLSLKNLVRLTEIFDVDINELIYDTGENLTVATPQERPLRSLSALLTGLNEKEMQHIIVLVQSLKTLRGK
ncbi:MAG: helix-turn-helix domain-containing protein [Defluviitaleaceae bacterium]|nr:helix-turn-helix domain-containing protein [Defluviitaleaceae bacterium]